MVMVSVEITLSHQRIEKHERSMMVSVEGKRHQTMKLSSTALKAALLVESCVELCAVHCVLWAVCCAVLSAVCCALLWAALLVMRGASRCKNCNRSGNCNATDIFGGTACTLFVFFLTHFGNKFQQHAEEHIGENEIQAQILTENWIWRSCHVWPCHEARVHYIFHLIISEYGYNYKLKMIIAYPSRVVFQKPGSSLEAWLAIQNVRPQLYSREFYLELWEH